MSMSMSMIVDECEPDESEQAKHAIAVEAQAARSALDLADVYAHAGAYGLAINHLSNCQQRIDWLRDLIQREMNK